MTGSPAVPDAPFAQVTIGAIAARTVTDELRRAAGPKTGLLIGVDVGSAVLAVAVETLVPNDRLAVVPLPGVAPAALRAHIEGYGTWVADRVRVADSPGTADPADVIVMAEPVTGTADSVRAQLEELTKHLNPGGVLVAATIAVPGLGGEAAAELNRQSVLFGAGSDLVLRNSPPLRVHRLRFSAADPAMATRMAPARRPSSVRLSSRMHIDSNGVAAAGISLGLAALAKLTQPKSRLWLLPALAAVPVAAFFRDPERDSPDDDAAVVAASDGKVLSVERISDARLGDEEFLRIAVFLSVLDVHVNRAPVAGRVTDYFIADGGYAAAMKPAAEHNVAAYTVLDTVHGTVVVAQRTGLIARRIVQRAPVGALLARGERFGLIRFGSRTDVYLPAARAQARVAPGDRVYGGRTPIARWTG